MEDNFLPSFVKRKGRITKYQIDNLKDIEKYGNEKSILLLDERSYHGGRLLTNKRPKFELGAARFNDNHVLLKKLLKKYNK